MIHFTAYLVGGGPELQWTVRIVQHGDREEND